MKKTPSFLLLSLVLIGACKETPEPPAATSAATGTSAATATGTPAATATGTSTAPGTSAAPAPTTTTPPIPIGRKEAPGPAPAGMSWVPAGTFAMGGAGEVLTDSLPIHDVTLDGFWIDRTEVTNEQFAAFVKETSHVTVSEKKPDQKDLPGVPADKLVAGSACFHAPAEEVPLDNALQWWRYVSGADWRHPEGPKSSIKGKEKHPVVHVAWSDAVAFCQWAGKRLPTEAEWEYSSRGGKQRQKFNWGDTPTVDGKWMTNAWQGKFPSKNTKDDGFLGTAPVGKYKPNGYGLYDMAGNVWEWCSDWYRPDYYAHSPTHNPQGPESSHDPEEPGAKKKVLRGGSFLCSDQYCYRYTNAARNKTEVDTGAGHTGLRCVKTP